MLNDMEQRPLKPIHLLRLAALARWYAQVHTRYDETNLRFLAGSGIQSYDGYTAMMAHLHAYQLQPNSVASDDDQRSITLDVPDVDDPDVEEDDDDGGGWSTVTHKKPGKRSTPPIPSTPPAQDATVQ